jgi:hypothetical protein
MDGADVLQQTHRGQILLAWRNPVTGETRVGGAIHADLISVEEIDEVLAAASVKAGRKIKMMRIRLDGMGFWDVDQREFITREVAIARRIEKPNKPAAPIEVVVVCTGGS